MAIDPNSYSDIGFLDPNYSDSSYFNDNDINQFREDYNLGTPIDKLNSSNQLGSGTPSKSEIPDYVSGNANTQGFAAKAPALSAANNYGYAAKPAALGLASLAPGFVGLAAKTASAALNAKNVDAVQAARASLGLPSLSLADMAKGVVGVGPAAKGQVGDVTVGKQSFSVSLDPAKNPTSYNPADISTISETLGQPVTAATPEASKALAAKAKTVSKPSFMSAIGLAKPAYAPTEVTTPTPTVTATPEVTTAAPSIGQVTATPTAAMTSAPTTSTTSAPSLGHMTGIGLDLGRFSNPAQGLGPSYNPSLTAPPAQAISFNPAAITAPAAAPVAETPDVAAQGLMGTPTAPAAPSVTTSPTSATAAFEAPATQGLSTAAQGLASHSAKSLAQALSDPTSMSPAQAAALGFGPSLSKADAKTVGTAMAGELGPSAVADIAKGQVSPADVTSIGTVGTSMANRSAATTGIPGAKSNFGNVAAVASQPGQYDALSPGIGLATSKANYGLNPSAFDAVAQGFFSGALASKYGLDTAVANPTASHYANLSISQPSWAETPSFQATAMTDPTGHTSGKLAEVGYASMTPGVADAISQAAMEAATSMDATSSVTGQMGLANPDFSGYGTPTSALDVGVNQGLSAVGAPTAAAPAATGQASVSTGFSPSLGPNPGAGLASPSLDTGTTGTTSDAGESDTGAESSSDTGADSGAGASGGSGNGAGGESDSNGNGANGEGDGEGNR